MGDTTSGDGLRLLRLIGDTPEMRELSVAEQRYQAVLAVISDGETVTDVAARFGVTRKTVHDWLARTRPAVWRTWVIGPAGPGRVRTRWEAIWRSRSHGCGPRIPRGGHGGSPSSWPERAGASKPGVYRALVRLHLNDPAGRRRRDRKWKRWEREAPMARVDGAAAESGSARETPRASTGDEIERGDAPLCHSSLASTLASPC